MWDKGKEQPKNLYENLAKTYGLRDLINREFVDMYHDQDHPEKRIEIKALEEKNKKRLFNPFLGLNGEQINLLKFWVVK